MGGGMTEVSIEQRFHGTVALAILHLRRLAHSNDVDAGFAAAHELKMISAEHERFIRDCFDLDARLQVGEESGESVTAELINELQACVLRLNSADPA